MIDWLLMISHGGVDGRNVNLFDGDFLGDRASLLQCLHHAYLEVLGNPMKNGKLTGL